MPVSDKGNLWKFISLIAVALAVISSELVFYVLPSSAARILLLTGFFLLLILVLKSCIPYSAYDDRKRLSIVFLALLSISLFFFLRVYPFAEPNYLEGIANSEGAITLRGFAETGALVFDWRSPHSYFFLNALLTYYLSIICGISSVSAILVARIVQALLAVVVSIYVLNTIYKINGTKFKGAGMLLPALIAFSVVAFSYSERGNPACVVFLILMCYLYNQRDKDAGGIVTATLLVVACTLGETVSIFVMITLFFLYALFARRTIALVYGFIPLAYMVFVAYPYTIRLGNYATFAYNGFIEFLEKITSGQIPWRVIPWHRTTSVIQEDTYVTSAAYLSIFLVSAIVALTLTYVWTREWGKRKKGSKDVFVWSILFCFWLWLGMSAFTYIGGSAMPEASISDVRTINVVALTLLLPFLLMSMQLMASINSNRAHVRVLLAFVVVLLVVASLGNIFRLYPKSIYDPINVVEDDRLGSTTVYKVRDFMNTYYKTGGIIGDYAVLKRISFSLLSPQYECSWIHESIPEEPSEVFPKRTILVFNIAGLKYPSMYHSSDVYVAAYNFSMANNVIYNNGWVLVASHRGATSE